MDRGGDIEDTRPAAVTEAARRTGSNAASVRVRVAGNHVAAGRPVSQVRMRRGPGACPLARDVRAPGRHGPLREMARLEGFEPPTNGFGSHYSIRLSYRRVVPRPRAAGRAGGAF